MKRIDTTNRELNLFGPGKDGFRNGNLALNVLPTEFNADWANGVQEELLSVIEAADLPPDGGDLSQVRKAIDVLLRKRSGIVAAAGGTGNAITGAFNPAVTALSNGQMVMVRAAAANSSTTPTFKADGTDAKTIVRPDGTPLVLGDITGAGHWLELLYDLTLDVWMLCNPARPESQGASCMVTGFARNTAPSGWLKANGAAVAVASYPTLAADMYCGNAANATAAWGYRCDNPASPSSTRNIAGAYIVLPDMRGEFPRGWDDGKGTDPGRSLWALQLSQNLSHGHTGVSDTHGGHAHGFTAYGSTSTQLAAGSTSNPGTFSGQSTNTGGAHSHNLTINADGGTEARSRNVALLFCIKY